MLLLMHVKCTNIHIVFLKYRIKMECLVYVYEFFITFQDLFSKYGRIVNLRIHSKQNASNRPHYGFLIFEEASTVQSLLHAEVRTA